MMSSIDRLVAAVRGPHYYKTTCALRIIEKHLKDSSKQGSVPDGPLKVLGRPRVMQERMEISNRLGCTRGGARLVGAPASHQRRELVRRAPERRGCRSI